MLNIGCGNQKLKGFVNIDIVKSADIRRDVKKGLPFNDGSVSLIYSEHFFEHLSQRDGLQFLRECRRVLTPGGTLRIAMPDLDNLVERYSSKDWRADGDMFRMGFDWVDNKCEMMNIAMREWGHRWLYNEEELTRVLLLSGLRPNGRKGWGESDIQALSGLETRASSLLILEAVKRSPGNVGDTPLISILIPAYKADFFEDALDSACAQDYPNIEIIVCDDNSSDDIKNITLARSKQDARIKYFRNSPSKGPLFNYVTCLEYSNGEYIQFLNDDDVLSKNAVSQSIKPLLFDKCVTLVSLKRIHIDAKGNVIPKGKIPNTLMTIDGVVEGAGAIRYLLSLGKNFIGEPSSCMFRRRDIAFIRPHLMSFGGAVIRGLGDFAIWSNLLSQGDMAYVSGAYCNIRVHDNQWQNSNDLRAISKDKWKLMRRHAFRLGLYGGYFGTKGLPEPIAFFSGYKYRLSDSESGAWIKNFPSLKHTMLFALQFAKDLFAIIRRRVGR